MGKSEINRSRTSNYNPGRRSDKRHRKEATERTSLQNLDIKYGECGSFSIYDAKDLEFRGECKDRKRRLEHACSKLPMISKEFWKMAPGSLIKDCWFSNSHQEEPASSLFTDLDFQYASFWIHFHHLPLAYFSRKMDTAFGNLVGNFETEESDDEGMCWGRTMRVRIRIDVKKPLRRVVKLKVGSMGEETLIPITYESLPDFCYGCGELGHVLKDCDSHSKTAEEKLQYGDWLRDMRRKMGSRKEGDEKFKGRETKGRRAGKRTLMAVITRTPGRRNQHRMPMEVIGIQIGRRGEGDGRG